MFLAHIILKRTVQEKDEDNANQLVALPIALSPFSIFWVVFLALRGACLKDPSQAFQEAPFS